MPKTGREWFPEKQPGTSESGIPGWIPEEPCSGTLLTLKMSIRWRDSNAAKNFSISWHEKALKSKDRAEKYRNLGCVETMEITNSVNWGEMGVSWRCREVRRRLSSLKTPKCLWTSKFGKSVILMVSCLNFGDSIINFKCTSEATNR